MTYAYEIKSELFNNFVNTNIEIEKIAHGFTWVEGPVWFKDTLYFNDIPNKKMYSWNEKHHLSIVLNDTDFANGNTLGLDGNLVSCEHGGRRVISRNDINNLSDVTLIADKYLGKQLNSPNDVVVKSDGSIWFTDPPYGINSNVEGYLSESAIQSNNVYRVDVSGKITCVIDDFDKPNGLAFSPDEKKLYIADSGAIQGASFPTIDYSKPHHIRVFDVHENTLINGRIFIEIEPGIPDGFRVDHEGYLWVSSADSLRCISPDGELIGKIMLPEAVSNCCFGGDDGTDLFITSTSSVYRVRTNRTCAVSAYR